MKFSHLVLRDFCQHRNLDLELAPGLVGLLGRNSSGKSNVIRALRLLVTGQLGDADWTLSDCINWDATEAELSLGLLVGSTQCELNRIIRPDESPVHLQIGGEEHSASSSGYERLFDVLGASSDILGNVTFIPQGSLGSLLFGPPGVRKELFQRLFGTYMASKARDLLMEELAHVPAEDHEKDLKIVRDELSSNEGALVAFQEEIEKLEEEQDGADQQGWEKQIARHTLLLQRREQAKQELTEIIAQLSKMVPVLQDRLERQNAARVAVTQLESQEDSVQQVATLYDEQGLLRHQHKTIEKTHKQTADALAQLPVVDIIALQKEQGDLLQHEAHLAQEMKRVEAFLGLQTEQVDTACPICDYQSAAKEGECPFCCQSLPESLEGMTADARERIGYDLLDARGRLTHVKTEIEQARDIETRKKLLGDELERTKNKLAELQQVEFVPDDAAAAARTILAKLSEHRKLLSDPVVQQSIQQLSNLQEKREKLEEECQALAIVDETGYNEAKVKLERYRAIEQKLANLKGQVSQLARVIEGLRSKQQELQQQLEVDKLRAGYRTKLDSAKMILHKDNLPARAAQTFLGGMNVELRECLERFDLDFAAWIDPDLAPRFQKAGNELSRPGKFLSGGERVAFAIAFVVALWRFLLPGIDVLVLDEPTVFLDKDRVESLIDFFDVIRAYCQEAEKQIILATHDERLASTFNQVIQL